ncbi:MAG: hypothetical protein HZB31_01005 [Nitrospirae bacterium]|nr:hypothetical protein [Nitrospirota bacterium]
MNLKESLISSFFFHLIMFLLMIAAVNFTAGLPGGIGKIIPIELAIEKSKDQPAFRSNAEEEPPQDQNQPMVLPDQDMSNQPKERAIVPESQKKAEPAAVPAIPEAALQPPIRTEGFSSLEAYHQFLILHKKLFGRQAGIKVNELIGEALKTNRREFYGGIAVVSLQFGTDGSLHEVSVESASPDLKAFLEEINWSIVPPPSAFSLGYAGVQIQITVLEGYMNFSINTR